MNHARNRDVGRSERLVVKPVHPFPARMAASIALEELRNRKGPLRVLDPMAGSGTTLVVAKSQGHTAIGFDTDPMAVLLAKAWCLDVRESEIQQAAQRVLKRARVRILRLKLRDSYPCPPEDKETRAFVRYWFDKTNRRQLTALSAAISSEPGKDVKILLWCAFSRMIITKQASVSLAMDLAHSRPHRVRDRSSIRPFEKYPSAVKTMLASAPFKGGKGPGRAKVQLGDARRLPLRSGSIDLVITSPPYLNAIDYLRCHKFSLVWMGHSIVSMRALRRSNIGTEVGLRAGNEPVLGKVIKKMTGNKPLSARCRNILERYVTDMRGVVREIARVLAPGGRATFVVGNSTRLGVFVRNSHAVRLLGQRNGLSVLSARSRVLPSNRRYLPPPSRGMGAIRNRMRTEVVLTLEKSRHEKVH